MIPTPEQRLLAAAREIAANQGRELSSDAYAVIVLPLTNGDDLRVPVIFGEV